MFCRRAVGCESLLSKTSGRSKAAIGVRSATGERLEDVRGHELTGLDDSIKSAEISPIADERAIWALMGSAEAGNEREKGDFAHDFSDPTAARCTGDVAEVEEMIDISDALPCFFRVSSL